MKKHIILTAIILILSANIFAAVIHIPQDYPTIQMGIDSAAAGDSVVVADGIYYEHLVLDKRVSLFGEDRLYTVIDGSGSRDVVRISADNAKVGYFTIQNCGQIDSCAGAKFIDCDSSAIRSCHLVNNRNGIIIENASFNEIRFCHIDSNQTGINLMEPSSGGTRQIEQNTIMNNIIENNSVFGISFSHTGAYHHYKNDIFGNLIKTNPTGIDMIMSQSNNIYFNDFIENADYAVSIAMCMGGGDSNIIGTNAFYGNHGDSIQGFDMLGNNRWWIYDGFGGLHSGNYWSDYSDSGQPYPIGGGQTADEYPLRAAPRSIIVALVNDSNGIRLSGVTVTVIGAGAQIVTDTTGLAYFDDLDAGYWHMQFSKDGYRDTIIYDVPVMHTLYYPFSVILRQSSYINSSNGVVLPNKIQLLPNYPNPFNSSTNIRFELQGKSWVKIDIYNILGQQIARLFEGELSAGAHTVPFEASGYPSGMYFCRMESDGKLAVQKLQLIK
jgi:hypothetical protein